MVHQLIQAFSNVNFVFDALDECSQRVELLQILAMMREWRLGNTHIVVTSRRERDIETRLQEVECLENSLTLERDFVDEDIRQYVRQRLSNDKAMNKWVEDSALREEIETTLIGGSQGMYVLRHL